MIAPVACATCARYKQEKLNYWPICEAFPDGIPDEIASGKNGHEETYPGDHGLQYDPIPEVAAKVTKKETAAI